MRIRTELLNLQPYHAGERRADTTKLSSNENPLGCSPLAHTAVQQAIAEAHYYPDGSARDLCGAIAADNQCPVESIIPGNGSDEILTMAAATYLNPGDRVLIGAHTFSQYRFAATLFGATVHTVPMDDLHMNPRLFLRYMEEAVRVVFLCSPNNPTGLCISRDDFAAFMEAVPADTLVVLDHAYMEYQDDPAAVDGREFLDAYPNLLVLRTFSKVHGLANLRVGYGMAAPERIAEMQRVRSPFNVGGIAQAAATAALQDGAFVRKTIETNQAGRQRFEQLFTDLQVPWIATQANFMMVNVQRDARIVAEEIARRGYTVRALGSFGLPRHLRITIGTPQQIDGLEPVLREVLAQ